MCKLFKLFAKLIYKDHKIAVLFFHFQSIRFKKVLLFIKTYFIAVLDLIKITQKHKVYKEL